MVLDIACGSGIGADLLTATARTVIGADVSPEAAEAAKARRVPGYHVCLADGTRLPFRTGSMDAVTSFETLEHVEADQLFLEELRRVLAPAGVLILSTPNAHVTKPVDGIPHNPFHIREYTPEELSSLLSATFAEVELYGQRTSSAYGACPYWEGSGPIDGGWRSWTQATTWKLLARLPTQAAEAASRRLMHRPLYPTSTDFVFETPVDRAHVLVAICRPDHAAG